VPPQGAWLLLRVHSLLQKAEPKHKEPEGEVLLLLQTRAGPPGITRTAVILAAGTGPTPTPDAFFLHVNEAQIP